MVRCATMETLIFWLSGAVLCLVAVPFFTRKDASSPLQALGFALMLGAPRAADVGASRLAVPILDQPRP